MKKMIVAVGLLTISTGISAQSVTESWLRQAGISCGGGLGVELQGELDTAVFRKLKIAKIEGEGQYEQSDVENLLRQFADEEKSQTYDRYVSCFLNVMGVATAASNLPPREVVLDSPFTIAKLETIRRGDRFAMEPGDTIAILDDSLIFTVDAAELYGDRKLVYFSWSNSESGESESKEYAYQSQLINLGENCALTPYKIDLEVSVVSFISNC